MSQLTRFCHCSFILVLTKLIFMKFVFIISYIVNNLSTKIKYFQKKVLLYKHLK